MSESLELPSSLSEGDAQESGKPRAGAPTPASLAVKTHQQLKHYGLRG